MSSEFDATNDEALAEVAKIINRTGESVEIETLMKGLTYLAVPVVSLYKYLIDSDISEETAEDMILWVWRAWFERGNSEPDFFDHGSGDD